VLGGADGGDPDGGFPVVVGGLLTEDGLDTDGGLYGGCDPLGVTDGPLLTLGTLDGGDTDGVRAADGE